MSGVQPFSLKDDLGAVRRRPDGRTIQGVKTNYTVPLVVFVFGAVIGAGAVSVNTPEYRLGLCILSVLVAAVFYLNHVAERSDKRLLAGETSFRAFFEHAIEGIFRTTPDGQYLDVNPALARIYGYPNREALMAMRDIGSELYVDPQRREQFAEIMQAHDIVHDFISQIRRKDGSIIWIAENARALRDWSGKIVCYEGTVEDITAQMEAQIAMREALQRSEEANEAKNAFLAAMSHELKTPLNAVLGFSEILRKEVYGPLGHPSYKGYANDIHSSGAKLLAIINDVLDVARLEGGHITLAEQDCHPLDIGENAIALAQRISGTQRPVALNIPVSLPTVSVDPQRLTQVLVNLLANAIKFTAPTEDISLRSWLDKNGSLSFAVEDKGMGMAPEKIAAALEPFRQLDRSLSRRFEETGLGLPIARALVELHGGKLTIDSAVGRGTVVTIDLPENRTRQAAAPAALSA